MRSIKETAWSKQPSDAELFLLEHFLFLFLSLPLVPCRTGWRPCTRNLLPERLPTQRLERLPTAFSSTRIIERCLTVRDHRRCSPSFADTELILPTPAFPNTGSRRTHMGRPVCIIEEGTWSSLPVPRILDHRTSPRKNRLIVP